MGAFIERQNEILIGKKERIVKIPKLEQIWVYLKCQRHQESWFMPLFLAHRRQREEEFELKDSLGYIARCYIKTNKKKQLEMNGGRKKPKIN